MTSGLDLRDDLLELADRYETVAALDLEAARAATDGARPKPGSRVPPGAQEILDADEVHRALTAVDDWTEFVAHVIADECDATMPDLTPARLRTTATHAAHLATHPDELLALSVRDDVTGHLRVLRRLAGRGVRRVQTGMRCQSPTCDGRLVSPLGTTTHDRADAALVCDKCAVRVPYAVWSSWPRARVTYVTVEHAARIAGTTPDAVKMRASRGKWRRVGTGREIRYHVDDVRGGFGIAS